MKVQRGPIRRIGQPEYAAVEFLGAASGNFDRFVMVAPYACRVVAARVVFDTTVADDATNYWSITLQDGATAISAALTNAAADFTADTPQSFVLDSDADVIDAGDPIRVLFTDVGGGSPGNLSAVRIMVQLGFEPR